MKSVAREFRLIPAVLIAATCLLALKLFGLAFDGGYTLLDLNFASGAGGGQADPAKVAASPETLAAAPSPRMASGRIRDLLNGTDITGSTAAKSEEKPAAKSDDARPTPVAPPNSGPDGTVVPLNGPPPLSPGERAVLERLQERRQELEARSRELDIRENLLKTVEKRLEQRGAELKATEDRIKALMHQKDEADAAKFRNVITMYENMKAKDAAKIFDRLDKKILLEVAAQINPRRMSDILAQMSAENAEQLTVELASRAGAEKSQPAAELPKIEGKPNGS